MPVALISTRTSPAFGPSSVTVSILRGSPALWATAARVCMLDPPEQGRQPSIVRFIVVPAKAGTHFSAARTADKWIPAFAGMTRRDAGEDEQMARIAVG